MSSPKLSSISRRLNIAQSEKSPAPESLGVTLEALIQQRVDEAFSKQPVQPARVQQIVAPRPKPEAPDPALERMLDRSVRDQVAIALQERQALLDAQLDRQQQALDMHLARQREAHDQLLSRQREEHQQQLMQRQFEAPAPMMDPKIPPAPQHDPMQATIERDGAGLARAVTVNGRRFLAQRDGAGKLLGIVSEDV